MKIKMSKSIAIKFCTHFVVAMVIGTPFVPIVSTEANSVDTIENRIAKIHTCLVSMNENNEISNVSQRLDPKHPNNYIISIHSKKAPPCL